jgi:integration host factor subunit alpha
LLTLEDTSKRRVAVMTRARADIVDDIHEKLGNRYSNREVADILESVFDIIKETAQREGKIVISGFGVFATKNKRARRGRNPQTGSDLQISPRRILTFKPSPVLNASVNRATGETKAKEVPQKEG